MNITIYKVCQIANDRHLENMWTPVHFSTPVVYDEYYEVNDNCYHHKFTKSVRFNTDLDTPIILIHILRGANENDWKCQDTDR
jgi:hypothetical protein